LNEGVETAKGESVMGSPFCFEAARSTFWRFSFAHATGRLDSLFGSHNGLSEWIS